MKHAVLFAALLAAAALPVRAQLAPPAAPAAKQSLESRIAEVTDTDLLGQLIARYRETGDKEAEMAALDRRIALRPHLGSYKLDKLVTLAREGNKNQAYTLLVELQSAGYGYDLRNDPQLANIADTEVWKYIVDNLDANRAPFGAATVVYTLPREDLLIQSLAWDASRKALLVGSARQGSVSIVNAAGKLEPLVKSDADNGLWSVYDMAVDAKRGVLWVASTAVPHFKGYSVEKDLGRAGVFKFDLKTGKFLKSYLSPVEESGQAHFMSSIALGKDGEVYVADGVNRAVYQVRDEQFRRILHLPMLSAISALVVSGDGSKLYLADPERGPIGVELGTLKPFDVRVPPKLTLESIASMEWVDGALVVVQNGMIPKRVMRLDLSPEGNLIAGVRPLEASNPAFGVPGDLSVDGNDIYLIANDQKGNYDRFGLLNDKEKLEGTRILKLRADYQAPGAMQMPQAGGGVLKD
ncbi:MAG: hypothetical protein KDI69_08545 [Xanthomonadales bacterium]|nr:hypothetical protein [Xanthomonadales bacterium]